MSEEIKLDSIEEAIEAIRNGEVIIVVDDENRENEGDFICAAEKVTPEIINFMVTHGRGLVCAPLVESRCEELGLAQCQGDAEGGAQLLEFVKEDQKRQQATLDSRHETKAAPTQMSP